MDKIPENTLKQIHQKFATDLFNSVWSYLDKKDRTPNDDAKMIHCAHASLFHWMQIGTKENIYTGEWQISRVYATLHMTQSALYHAERALQICLDQGFNGFNLAYAYEAMARTYMIMKDEDLKNKYLELARNEAKSIKDMEYRSMLLDDLKTIV
ncbi:MAG TPA: hypothetical protein PLE74_10925 [Candidatus Cloacimonadota bacterium]|nr:hypothetical protein [Candidatus Cloacimonadota bacterium]HPT72781.1 hypothetical protein [Candidatus Cloacimonadota bacterium]